MYAFAAFVLIAISGMLMLAAGNTFAHLGWAKARPIALAGGVAIELALFLERRGVRQRTELRPVVGRSLLARGAASGLVLFAGAGLVAIGFFSLRHGWWPIGGAVVVPVLAVFWAGALNRRAAAIRATRLAQRAPLISR